MEAAASEFGPEMLELVALFRAAADEEERAVWRSALADAYRAAAADGQEVCAALADELWREAALAEGIERKAPAAHGAMGRDEAMARVRSVAACLFERGWDDAKVLSSLQATLRASVEAAPNAAMAENIARASALQASLRYARVPSDAEACGFCFMIASLGFAYEAKGTSPDHPNHPSCRCRVVPGFEGQTSVEGFDFDAMRRRWGQCEAAVAHGDAWARASDAERRKLVQAECETRDPDWLWFGKEPKVTFETRELRDEIVKDRMHEFYTVARLRKHGINPAFVVDEAFVEDPATGRMRKVGLPDLAGGVEIKTLRETSSFNTVDGYIKNTSSKQGAKRLYFDNFENNNLSDKQLASFILRSRRFKSGAIYILGHDGKLHKIR